MRVEKLILSRREVIKVDRRLHLEGPATHPLLGVTYV
jgi:hypothetical protein